MTAVQTDRRWREPSLWQAVGNTPALPAGNRPRGAGRLWLKAEWLNPGGSVKDRAARAILRDAICRGELPAKRLLDASSGNTGIAYAMLGAAAGVEVTICLPGNASPERRALLEVYGAEVILTDRLEGTDGATRAGPRARSRAPRRATTTPTSTAIRPTPQAHRETTGPEIWAQTGGRITHFVAAMGTTGTMMGTGGYLKERNPAIRLVGVQPDSPFHGLEGLKHLATTSSPARALRSGGCPTPSPRFRPSSPTGPRAASPGRAGSWWAGRPERRSLRGSTSWTASPRRRSW